MAAGWCMVLLLLCSAVFGQRYDYCRSLWNPVGRSVLNKAQIINVTVVRAVALYFCEDRSVSVQLWEENVPEANYTLTWTLTVKPPTSVPGRQLVNLDMDGEMAVSRSLLVGLTPTDDGPIPVGAVFVADGSTRDMIPSYDPLPLTLGDSYQFQDLAYPYDFYIQVCEERDCPPLPEPPVEPTQPPWYGDEFAPCQLTQILPGGRVVIQDDQSLPQGRFQSVVTYFCERVYIDVQLWEEQAPGMYRLVWEKTLDPPFELGRRTVFGLTDSESFTITGSHRLGILVLDPQRDIPVSTEFVPTEPKVLQSVSNRGFQQGQNYAFDDLQFPFEFRIFFCPDKDCAIPTSAPPTEPMTTHAFVDVTSLAVLPVTSVNASKGPFTSSVFVTEDGEDHSVTSLQSLSSTPVIMTSSQFPDITVSPTKPPFYFLGPKGDTGDPGPKGETGEEGVGGGLGSKGQRGDLGIVGDPGVRGQPGPPGQAPPAPAPVTGRCECDSLQNEWLVLALLIWGFVLTIFIICLLIFVSRRFGQ